MKQKDKKIRGFFKKLNRMSRKSSLLKMSLREKEELEELEQLNKKV